MKHLDLFSGIGGFALAAQRVGWETVGFCEIDPYCQKVLTKNFPGIPIYDDVRELTSEKIGPVDIISGGYPCQPFSLAGRRRGEEDDRHLWPQFARLIRELRPRWVVGENVAGHINMGLDNVLSDLEGEGYSWESFVIPACAVDAKHRRDRAWIVAHARRNATRCGQELEWEKTIRSKGIINTRNRSKTMADTKRKRQQGPGKPINASDQEANREGETGDAVDECVGSKWGAEPGVGRVAHGIPAELDLYRGLMNEPERDSQTDSETLRQLRGRLLRAMWKYREIAKASPDLYRERLRDSLPEVPYEDSHGGWYLGAWIEENQGLRDLWEVFYSKPLEEAQDLQQELFERVRKIKRSKEVGPAKNRADRLKGLGNAIVPQVAEVIFRAIDEIDENL